MRVFGKPDFVPSTVQRQYMGLLKIIKQNNFVRICPRKKHVQLDLKLDKSQEIDEKIEQNGIEAFDYNSRHGTYRLQIYEEDSENKQEFLKDILY